MREPEEVGLAELLRERGLRPRRRLGQNFMVDRNMLDFLVRQADLERGDVVLEVGVGAGFLTQRLAGAAGRVVGVEIDAGLYELAAERLAGLPNLTLLHCDALSGKHSWHKDVREALHRALEGSPGGRPLKLVANLPYCAATAVVGAVLQGEEAFRGCWFTCQREVAGRLTARPGGRAYGYISVIVALLSEVRLVRELPPTVFWPRPKVDSAIVELVPSPAKAALVGDLKLLSRGVSALFNQRRKQVLKVLKASNLDENDILNVEKLLAKLGIAPGERIFRLAPPAIREIVEAVFKP